MSSKIMEWSTWNGKNLPSIGLNAFLNKMKDAEEKSADRVLLLTDQKTGERLKVRLSVEPTDIEEDTANALLDIHPDCWF